MCPPLLKGQPGFEWVQENFIKLLQRRLHYWDIGQKAVRDREGRLVGVDDQLFWGIAKNVRDKLNRGHPSSVVKDYARANRVMIYMMFQSTATGQQITEPEAVAMVARYEVLQRVLDGARFLGEVAGLSKGEAQRIVASWGIDQRTGAVAFLKALRNCAVEDSEKLIDEWNSKQKKRRAKEFLEKKLKYSEAKAQATVAHWEIDTYVGKNIAIKFLVKEHGYKELEAEKIVTRWGNTGELEGADPSPISRSLRVVEGQGLWAPLGDIGHSDNEYAQQVRHLILKPMYGTSEQLKDGEADESTKKKRLGVKNLSTKQWLEQIKGGGKSQVRKTHSQKTEKRREK